MPSRGKKTNLDSAIDAHMLDLISRAQDAFILEIIETFPSVIEEQVSKLSNKELEEYTLDIAEVEGALARGLGRQLGSNRLTVPRLYQGIGKAAAAGMKKLKEIKKQKAASNKSAKKKK